MRFIGINDNNEEKCMKELETIDEPMKNIIKYFDLVIGFFVQP